jgi:hypothetical protein
MAENIENTEGTEETQETKGTVLTSPVEDVAKEATPEEGAATDAKDGQADEASEGAPEAYADFTLPEGMEVDKELLEEFNPIAKDLNLTQEQAQSLVDLQTKQMQKFSEAQQEAWQSVLTEWNETAKNDQEIGGAEYNAKVATAKKALDEFGTPELLEALDATGVGNHPELIRVFYRIGKLVEDDTINFGKASAPTKTAAQILYPNMA